VKKKKKKNCAKMEEAWKKFISATQVKSVLSENAENKLITLHATDTIDYALDVLAKHSISSAPGG
jgi:citrate lyase synthetase